MYYPIFFSCLYKTTCFCSSRQIYLTRTLRCGVLVGLEEFNNQCRLIDSKLNNRAPKCPPWFSAYRSESCRNNYHIISFILSFVLFLTFFTYSCDWPPLNNIIRSFVTQQIVKRVKIKLVPKRLQDAGNRFLSGVGFSVNVSLFI